MLNYNHVYYFHVCAAEGSVARAAERLGVTQPTVSEQIRQLEKTLGVSLFQRSTTGLRLTEAGRQAFEHTTAMFRAGERMVEALGGLGKDSMPPTLRVGITSGVSRVVAADFLMPVLQLEDCIPSVRTADLPDLVRDLRAHDLDLLLCEGEPVDAAQRGLELVTLHQPRLVGIAAPGHEPAGDWGDAYLIHYRSSSVYRWEAEAWLDANGKRPTVAAETDDALLMVEAVIRGKFISFVPRSCARDAVTAGRLRVLSTLEPGSATIHAAYHDGRAAALARRAVELLAEHARRAFDPS